MNESIELLKKINWFLEPISKFILFLFTSKIGIILLIISLLIYIFVSTIDSISARSSTGSSSFGSRNIPFTEKLYLFLKVLITSLSGIIVRAPMLLGIMIFLTFIVGMSAGINGIETFVQKQKKIQELKSVVKMLDQSYQVAEMEVLDVDIMNGNTCTLKFKFFDYANMGFMPEEQTIKILGNDIYFDAIVMNFDYSQIETGTKKNITIPYRIFSNVLPQKEGIELNLKDKNGVPVMFHRDKKDIYTMPVDTFSIRLKELFSYLTDENKAREAGIRSSYGNAVHQYVFKGQTYIISVEQTGGLVMKRKEVF